MLETRTALAQSFLARFSALTDGYRHGNDNPYLSWLGTSPQLRIQDIATFLGWWFPVSRRQPQILLRLAAAFPLQSDREPIIRNYLEEDGLNSPGDSPHYVLLEDLIQKLGFPLLTNPLSEKLTEDMHRAVDQQGMTAAYASGVIAAIEFPALDISAYFKHLVRLSGRLDLLQDPYISIHTVVEPEHIIDSHSTALRFMETDRAEVETGFKSTMRFWEPFWHKAFVSTLNYQG